MGKFQNERMLQAKTKQISKSRMYKNESSHEKFNQTLQGESSKESLENICLRLIAEDENLSIQDPELIKKFETETDMNAYDSKILLVRKLI